MSLIKSDLYQNNLKNRFLTASVLPQNSCPHSRLASRQWSLAPGKSFEEPPCQNPDSSGCFGINLSHQAYKDFKILQSIPSSSRLWVQKGKICQIEGLFNVLRYLFSKNAYQSELKERVGQLVRTIDEHPSAALRPHKKKVRKFFFTHLARLSVAEFDRSDISKKGDLEKLLYPKLTKQRPSTEKKDPVSKKKPRLSLLEIQFALKLGVSPALSSSGSSGTYTVYDRSAKPRGVYKPIGQGPHAWHNPRLTARIWALIYQLILGRIPGNTGINGNETHLAEAGASRLDRHLKLRVVPSTRIVSLKSNQFYSEKKKTRGSLQLFSPPAIPASTYFSFPWQFSYLPRSAQRFLINNVSYIREKVTKHLPKHFQEMVILDLLDWNYDRHPNNWLVTKKKPRVVAIDNGNAFPMEKMKSDSNFLRKYLDHKFLHLWEVLPAANQRFSSSLKKRVLKVDFTDLKKDLKKGMVDPKDPKTKKHFRRKMRVVKARLKTLQSQIRKDRTIREATLKLIKS